MDMTVRHIVELSPSAEELLAGLVAALSGKAEVVSKAKTEKASGKQDQKGNAEAAEKPASTTPAKRGRKSRAKKEEAPVAPVPTDEDIPVETAPVEDAAAESSPSEDYTRDQVRKLAFAAFEKTAKELEAAKKAGNVEGVKDPSELTMKMKELGANSLDDLPEDNFAVFVDFISEFVGEDFVNAQLTAEA